MAEKDPFFISTTIPYVNGDPHIGHALEYVEADALARYKRLLGYDVFFLTGSDENSLKNVRAAEKAGKDTAEFVAEKAKGFERFRETLNISYNDFIRTTEERHFKGAQALWLSCLDDVIYKKAYKGLYCVGCESFLTEEELVEGKCPDHNAEPELVEEENYFFRLSQYQELIHDLLDKDVIKVTPQGKKNEMLAFIKRGLEDFSISRSVARAHGWGVPVPGDPDQIMYVWFDALANYISALNFVGFGREERAGTLFERYWMQPEREAEERNVVHVLGKGVARFHEVYWIGMLLAAGLPLPTQQFVHGYITVDGKKMSKSLGNVINPHDLVEQYSTDAVRYYFLAALSPFQDGDFSYEKFETYYTAHLVNGIGNLTSRIITMIDRFNDGVIPEQSEDIFDTTGYWKQYHEHMEGFAFHDALKVVQSLVQACDTTISDEKPWEKHKQGEDIGPLLYQLAEGLRHIALSLLPIIPESAEKILRQLQIDPATVSFEDMTAWGGLNAGTTVEKGEMLFPRL